MNRFDDEDYSVFRKPRIPLSGKSPEYTEKEAEEVRAAFKEVSRGLRIPQIRIPKGVDGFIHTSFMSALDVQDPPEQTTNHFEDSKGSRWSLIKIFARPFQIGRLQRVH